MTDIGADYELKIDFGRDETFAHDLADVSSLWLGLQWQVGMQESYQEMAPPSRLAFELRDDTGALQPDNTGSPYYGLLKRGVLVRLRASYALTLYTLWIGKIASVTPSVTSYGTRTIRVLCDDPMLALQDTEFTPELMQDVTVDTAISPIFDEGLVPYPYAHRYWLMGVVGSSEMGSTTRIYENTVTSFDTGSQTFNYTGDIDDTETGQSGYSFIQRYVAAEPGRFFYDGRTGKFTFHSRHRDVNNLTSLIALTAADMPQDRLPELNYGGDVVNAVTLNYIPREVGSAGTVIYSASNLPISIRAEDSSVFTARYHDTTEKRSRVGAITVLPMLALTDYVAEYGDGTSATGELLAFAQAKGTSAEITLRNPTTKDMSVTTLQLRGTPIITREQATIDEIDTASIYDYGRIELPLNIPALDNEEDARQYAGYTLGVFKRAVTRFPAVTVYANRRQETMIGALSYTVGDRITVQDEWTLHDKDYFIVGEQHVVQPSGAPGEHLHMVTWVLKPADRQRFWLLGVADYGELDFNTNLAY